jgi:hypothetical protein
MQRRDPPLLLDFVNIVLAMCSLSRRQHDKLVISDAQRSGAAN